MAADTDPICTCLPRLHLATVIRQPPVLWWHLYYSQVCMRGAIFIIFTKNKWFFNVLRTVNCIELKTSTKFSIKLSSIRDIMTFLPMPMLLNVHFRKWNVLHASFFRLKITPHCKCMWNQNSLFNYLFSS